MIGLTRTAALDYAADRIRVNSTLPGPIRTERLERVTPEMRARVAAAIPAGRLGLASEIAAAAPWPWRAEAGSVTGTELVIDGGRLAGWFTFDRGA